MNFPFRDKAEPITVAQLIEYLKQFPQDLQVIETRYSDYDFMRLDSWSVERAVNKVDRSGYIMRVYEEHNHTLSPEDKKNTKNYLHFAGN